MSPSRIDLASSDGHRANGDACEPGGAEKISVSLSSMLYSLVSVINRNHAGEVSPVVIRAIPIRNKSAKIFGGFIYCKLQDSVSREEIDASLPAGLADSVPWDEESIIVGFLSYQSQQRGIKPRFRVDNIRTLGGSKLQTRRELEERWADSIRRPKRNLSICFEADRPHVTIVSGNQSVAIDDIRAKLRELEAFVEIELKLVAVTQPELVANALRAAVGTNLLVLTRGGGAEVNWLDENSVLDAVANSPVPVAVALGHSTDRLVLDMVADGSFDTPTDFGLWMRKMLEEKQARLRRIEEARNLGETKELKSQLIQLQRSNEELVRKSELDRLKSQKVETELADQRKALLAELGKLKEQVESDRTKMNQYRQQIQLGEAAQVEADRLRHQIETAEANESQLLEQIQSLEGEVQRVTTLWETEQQRRCEVEAELKRDRERLAVQSSSTPQSHGGNWRNGQNDGDAIRDRQAEIIRRKTDEVHAARREKSELETQLVTARERIQVLQIEAGKVPKLKQALDEAKAIIGQLNQSRVKAKQWQNHARELEEANREAEGERQRLEVELQRIRVPLQMWKWAAITSGGLVLILLIVVILRG